MPGLNFQTCTIVNYNIDPDSRPYVTSDGKTTNKDDGEFQKLFKVRTNPQTEKNEIHIKRDFIFDPGCIKAVRKCKGYEEVACEATIDFAGMFDTSKGDVYARLDIYLGVEGAEPYIYSTPFVQKGIPLWVEFTVTSKNSDTIAVEIAKIIRKNHLFLMDKDLIDVEGTGTTLTLTGNSEYQRFRNIEVKVFDEISEYEKVVASLGDDYIELVEPGRNGFGTYTNIVKDLRLPTAANYQWTHIRQVETPIIGAIYDQYIVEYCAPSPNDGVMAVGERMLSTTTHVFWVRQDKTLTSEWDALFKDVEVKVEEVDPKTGKKPETAEQTNSEENTSESELNA